MVMIIVLRTDLQRGDKEEPKMEIDRDRRCWREEIVTLHSSDAFPDGLAVSLEQTTSLRPLLSRLLDTPRLGVAVSLIELTTSCSDCAPSEPALNSRSHIRCSMSPASSNDANKEHTYRSSLTLIGAGVLGG